MFLDDIPVNYLAVLAAAFVYLLIGIVWYAPFLFGGCRRREDAGKAHEDPPHKSTRCCISSYVGEIVLAWMAAYTLSLFIHLSQADEIAEGVAVALWVWFGFIATTQFSSVLWGGRSLKHFFVHAGFMLMGFAGMGATLMIVQLHAA